MPANTLKSRPAGQTLQRQRGTASGIMAREAGYPVPNIPLPLCGGEFGSADPAIPIRIESIEGVAECG
jgi:hypothetical protein